MCRMRLKAVNRHTHGFSNMNYKGMHVEDVPGVKESIGSTLVSSSSHTALPNAL